MTKLSRRISSISVSRTMAVLESASKLREQGFDVVDFGAGEPDFSTPENVKQAGIRAINDNFTRYTPAGGIIDLKKAIVERHARDFGSRYAPDEVLVTLGGKHGIFNVFSTVIDRGDDVVIPAPYWVSFPEIARFVGANPVVVEAREGDGFRITAAMLERAVTARTRLIVVNSPNNPTGAVVDEEQFVRIAKICHERGVLLLSDECYAHFLYDGRGPFSIGSVEPYRRSTIVVGSLSKTYAMTGWRIGYVLADRELIRAMFRLQSHSTSNPVSVAQKAAVEALAGPQDSVSRMLSEYGKRRRFVLDRIHSIPGVRCAEPGGAFYVYPNVSATFRDGVRSAADFATCLLEAKHVAVVPGEAFGTDQHVRICYATSVEQLRMGLDRIHAFVRELG